MAKLATDHAGLEIMPLADCFRLLEAVPVGRIGFLAGGEVVILPVNFLIDGQDVLFRTGTGSKMGSLEIGHYVGFEADSYDATTHSGWSVVANGLAEVVEDDEEIARLDALGLATWGAAEDQTWIRIRPTSITGRRIAGAAFAD